MATLHSLIDDPATPLLRDLAHATLGLQKVNIKRLYGDLMTISAAAVALTALANQISRMQIESDEGADEVLEIELAQAAE